MRPEEASTSPIMPEGTPRTPDEIQGPGVPPVRVSLTPNTTVRSRAGSISGGPCRGLLSESKAERRLSFAGEARTGTISKEKEEGITGKRESIGRALENYNRCQNPKELESCRKEIIKLCIDTLDDPVVDFSLELINLLMSTSKNDNEVASYVEALCHARKGSFATRFLNNLLTRSSTEENHAANIAYFATTLAKAYPNPSLAIRFLTAAPPHLLNSVAQHLLAQKEGVELTTIIVDRVSPEMQLKIVAGRAREKLTPLYETINALSFKYHNSKGDPIKQEEIKAQLQEVTAKTLLALEELSRLPLFEQALNHEVFKFKYSHEMVKVPIALMLVNISRNVEAIDRANKLIKHIDSGSSRDMLKAKLGEVESEMRKLKSELTDIASDLHDAELANSSIKKAALLKRMIDPTNKYEEILALSVVRENIERGVLSGLKQVTTLTGLDNVPPYVEQAHILNIITQLQEAANRKADLGPLLGQCARAIEKAIRGPGTQAEQIHRHALVKQFLEALKSFPEYAKVPPEAFTCPELRDVTQRTRSDTRRLGTVGTVDKE